MGLFGGISRAAHEHVPIARLVQRAVEKASVSKYFLSHGGIHRCKRDFGLPRPLSNIYLLHVGPLKVFCVRVGR